jgi:phosphoribosylformylglycinamidine synthase
LLLDGAQVSADLKLAPRPTNAPSPAQEFSSSECAKTVAGIIAGEPPAIDLAAEKRLQDCLIALAAGGALQSAHDVSDGGIAVTLAESCFASAGPQVRAQSDGGDAQVHLSANAKLEDAGPAEVALFGERGARAIVSVRPTFLARVLETARQYGVSARQIGTVIRGSDFRIEYNRDAVVQVSLDMLRDTWANSLERTLKVQ